MSTIKTDVAFALEAQQTGSVDEEWILLPGFVYDTQAELDAVYAEHFAQINGKGNVYRKVRITQTTEHKVLKT